MHTPITPTGPEAQSQLRRRLRSRHIMMIALSGAIGTGLFVASGASIATAGPGGALLTYTLIGVMVYSLMTSLGELAVHLPVSGSFVTYSRLYVEKGFGFALGWNYWFSLAVTVAVELAAAQLVMKYWFPGVSGMVWSAAFLLLMFGINAFSVRGFGETEYWFSMIKIVTIVVFLLIGLAMISGIMHGGSQSGWQNFTAGDAPFVGGLPAMVAVAMIAGFSFQGIETIGVAAGEAENPSRTIPRAIRQTFWRILLFYVLAILIIGVVLPYTDPNLLRNEATDIGVSPFTLVFQHAGLAFAAGMMNAVVLTALLSSGTSSLYVSTRILYDLSLEGHAPRWFVKVSGNGVPHRALVATSAVGALCFFSSLFGDQVVYLWLLNTSAVTCFIAWFGIALAHYRFRKGFTSQGHSLHQLAYRSPFFPVGPIMVAIMCVVIILGQNTKALLAPIDNVGAFVATYCGVFVFVAIWLGYRWKFKTRFVKYSEMQFSREHLKQDAVSPKAEAPASGVGAGQAGITVRPREAPRG